jgi:tRNA(fMet)-specific endonuclease VapC
MTAPNLYLLDTNIISYIMRNARGTVAQQYRSRLQSNPLCKMVTSVVVQCELAYGLTRRPSPRYQTAYDLQMQQLIVLPLDADVVSYYATIRTQLERQGTPIGPNDTLIAAHALSLNATLVSADAEYSRVPGLRVENWLE